ncbi:hypothetical protein BGZ83_001522 [Gryganskiella cystojenkinii]|nr:hypothetical protein BGZ83_001522 [Gryganskiella cystojenkinii]
MAATAPGGQDPNENNNNNPGRKRTTNIKSAEKMDEARRKNFNALLKAASARIQTLQQNIEEARRQSDILQSKPMHPSFDTVMERQRQAERLVDTITGQMRILDTRHGNQSFR